MLAHTARGQAIQRTKLCRSCGIRKRLTAEFWGRNKRAGDGWQTRCKQCATAAVLASRKAHPETTKRNDLASVRRRTARQRAYVRELRESGLCADCGLNPGAEVMQFDRVPELGEKVADISDLTGRWTGWPKLRAELAKCELVCADCHWHRTLRRRGRVFVRLPETAKAAIRRRRAAGERAKDLASEYGITPSRVSQITRGVRPSS